MLMADLQSVLADACDASRGCPMWRYLGNLHAELGQPWSSIILVVVAMIAGTLVGIERRSRDKPAGLRTLSLICVGSAIFTLVSVLIVGDTAADRGRIAAQVVTGIGFLGAGAIIRDRGEVMGLTTGATIWVTAAIGMMIGAGYGAGGLGLSVLVVGMLVLFRRHEAG